MELSEDQRKDLVELQSIQQQMQLVLAQKQQLMLLQNELDKASEEVEKSAGMVYRLAGSVLVQKEKGALQQELKDETEGIGVRLNAFGKQEKKLKEQFEALRAKLEKSFPKQPPAGDESISKSVS